MTKYSLRAVSLFFAILFIYIDEYYSYVPPSATVEPLYPIGLRISIPGEI